MRIPIRIKKNKSLAGNASLNLREKPKQKQPSKKWLFLSVFLMVVIVGLIACYFAFLKQIDPDVLISQESIVSAKVDYQEFLPLIDAMFLGDNGSINEINNYLAGFGLKFKDIVALFEDDLTVYLFRRNDQSDSPFILMLKEKSDISDVLEKMESGLKKDFDFAYQTYRQHQIAFLDPLFIDLNDKYAYARAGSWLLISNSEDVLKQTINNIIE